MGKPKLETTLDDDRERDDYLEAVRELGVSAAEDLRQHARSVIRRQRMRQADAELASLRAQHNLAGLAPGDEATRDARQAYDAERGADL